MRRTRPVWPAGQPEQTASWPGLAEAGGRPELDLALAARAGGRIGRSLWAAVFGTAPRRVAEVVQPVGAAPDVHRQVGLVAEELRRRRRRLGARALHVRQVAARPAQRLVRPQVVHAEAGRGRRVEGEQRQPCSG